MFNERLTNARIGILRRRSAPWPIKVERLTSFAVGTDRIVLTVTCIFAHFVEHTSVLKQYK